MKNSNSDTKTRVQHQNAKQNKPNRQKRQKKKPLEKQNHYQFDSGIHRVKKREGLGHVLANGARGGSGDQPQDLVGGQSSDGQPVHPVPGPTIVAVDVVAARRNPNPEGYNRPFVPVLC